MELSWELDGWIIMAGILCAVASSLIGTFLVLRKMSLFGDAISHTVLPGLALAFIVSGSRSGWVMFVGAAIVGVLTAVLTEWINQQGRVDENASMGVVFTTLFALGLIMIVQAADHIDLDASCVLYGAMELTPLDRLNMLGFEIPRNIVSLLIICALNLTFILVFYKELKLFSFDPALATTIGFHVRGLHYGLMTLVAITAVACFESVGSILVIAMMIVPPASALLLSSRLHTMIWIGVLISCVSAVLGHLAAIAIPSWFGMSSTTTAGMMTVVAGLIFGFLLLFAPQHGILVQAFRHYLLARQILNEDILAAFFRSEERGQRVLSGSQVMQSLFASRWSVTTSLWWLNWKKLVLRQASGFELTELGRQRARQMVRSHRLWEQYLSNEASLEVDRVHLQAERLEHFTDGKLQFELNRASNNPEKDPHGSRIPNSSDQENR